MHVNLDGERVRELREQSGISTRDLAAAAEISPTTAKRAERGETLELLTARKIGRALDADPRTFARAVSRRSA